MSCGTEMQYIQGQDALRQIFPSVNPTPTFNPNAVNDGFGVNFNTSGNPYVRNAAIPEVPRVNVNAINDGLFSANTYANRNVNTYANNSNNNNSAIPTMTTDSVVVSSKINNNNNSNNMTNTVDSANTATGQAAGQTAGDNSSNAAPDVFQQAHDFFTNLLNGNTDTSGLADATKNKLEEVLSEIGISAPSPSTTGVNSTDSVAATQDINQTSQNTNSTNSTPSNSVTSAAKTAKNIHGTVGFILVVVGVILGIGAMSKDRAYLAVVVATLFVVVGLHMIGEWFKNTYKKVS